MNRQRRIPQQTKMRELLNKQVFYNIKNSSKYTAGILYGPTKNSYTWQVTTFTLRTLAAIAVCRKKQLQAINYFHKFCHNNLKDGPK